MEVQVLSRAQYKNPEILRIFILCANCERGVFVGTLCIMHEHTTKRYFFFGLFFICAAFVGVLLWPFLKVIVLSVVFAVLLSPVYRWVYKKITGRIAWLASVVTIILFLVVVCVPLALIIKAVSHQTQDIFVLLSTPTKTAAFLHHISTTIAGHFPWAPLNLDGYTTTLIRSLSSGVGDIISIIFTTLFNTLLMILSMFYLLKDGKQWYTMVTNLSPLSTTSTTHILETIRHAIVGIFRGYFVVALAQGILLGVGLWIFDVPNPALFGLLAGVASLIPTFGTALVSIPSVLYLVATKHPEAAFGLAIWAVCLVGIIDNVLNPYVVGKSVAVHPLLILFAVLGGVALMGPIGIIIGPLAIACMFAVTSVYSSEMKEG